ncbi:hypothetical protein GGC63_003452 [Paenibacillus sp. OAS669]|nr:hypothetical protein [Paenibacillus sp. OAS669]
MFKPSARRVPRAFFFAAANPGVREQSLCECFFCYNVRYGWQPKLTLAFRSSALPHLSTLEVIIDAADPYT